MKRNRAFWNAGDDLIGEDGEPDVRLLIRSEHHLAAHRQVFVAAQPDPQAADTDVAGLADVGELGVVAQILAIHRVHRSRDGAEITIARVQQIKVVFQGTGTSQFVALFNVGE
jgi:hypothetical protein